MLSPGMAVPVGAAVPAAEGTLLPPTLSDMVICRFAVGKSVSVSVALVLLLTALGLVSRNPLGAVTVAVS